jgi:radical SAM protein with 4Fe4S-binding SPASM domain
MRGLAALFERRRGAPEVGLTCVVTPANHLHIEELFLQAIDLGPIGSVSIELQSWATEEQHRQYARLLREEFGVPAAPHARAYVRDPARFALMDRAALSRQLERVRAACVARGIRFYSQPKLAGEKDLDQYLRGDFAAMAERKSRCAFPWTYAEISARGDVATCHTFYDLPLGNVHEKTLLEIWHGEPLQRLRAQVRKELLPICTACCRYWQ